MIEQFPEIIIDETIEDGIVRCRIKGMDDYNGIFYIEGIATRLAISQTGKVYRVNPDYYEEFKKTIDTWMEAVHGIKAK